MHLFRTLSKDKLFPVQMGCFFRCFGLEKKKKCVNSRIRRSSAEKNHGSYVPLDTPEKNISSDSELKEKPKESSRLRIKKKVTFNLNVQAYEPIPKQDDISTYLSEGDELKKWESGTEKSSTDWLKNEEDSILSSIRSFPQNYRYQNCGEGYDDEDEELRFEECDLNFDDIEDMDGDDEDVYSSESDEEMGKESDFEVVDDEKTEERISSCEQVLDLKDNDLERLRPSYKTRDRGRYVLSVLNPVENLNQWKSVKAKAAPPKKPHKENSGLENQEQTRFSNLKPDSELLVIRSTQRSNGCSTPGHNIAVDASLSNWLGSK